MNHHRLLIVRRAVKAAPASSFDMNYWWRETDCGTVGCAAGYTCLRPEANETGLRLINGRPFYAALDGGTWMELDAMIEWLGCDPREAMHLFYAASYVRGRRFAITKTQVLRRIDEYLRR